MILLDNYPLPDLAINSEDNSHEILFQWFYKNHEQIPHHALEGIFQKLWQSLDDFERYKNDDYVDYQHITLPHLAYLRILYECRYRVYYIIYENVKCVLMFDEIDGHFTFDDKTISIPLKQYFQTDDQWIITNRQQIDSKVVSEYYFYTFEKNILEVVDDDTHIIYQLQQPLSENEFYNIDHSLIDGILIFKANQKNQSFFACHNGQVVLDISETTSVMKLSPKKFYDNLYEHVNSLHPDLKIENKLAFEDNHFFVTDKYYGIMSKFIGFKNQIIYPFSIFVEWKNTPTITYNASSTVNKNVRCDVLKQTQTKSIIKISYIRDNFDVIVHQTLTDCGVKYNLRFTYQNKTIAYFRFIGHSDDTKEHHTDVDYSPTDPGLFFGGYLMRMSLPEKMSYTNTKKKFEMLDKWKCDYNSNVVETDIIELFWNEPEKIFMYLQDQFNWQILLLMTQYKTGHDFLCYDIFKGYPVSSLTQNDNDYYAIYYPDLSQYSLRYYAGGATGGAIGGAKGKMKEVVKADKNIKIDMKSDKVVMNNENNEIVEIDIKTNSSTLIMRGYKYGWFYSPKGQKQVIVELEILKNSKTICCSNKNRTDHCKVLAIYDEEGNSYPCAYGKFSTEFMYTVDQVIKIEDFSLVQNVCMNGIHFCETVKDLKYFWGKTS